MLPRRLCAHVYQTKLQNKTINLIIMPSAYKAVLIHVYWSLNLYPKDVLFCRTFMSRLNCALLHFLVTRQHVQYSYTHEYVRVRGDGNCVWHAVGLFDWSVVWLCVNRQADSYCFCVLIIKCYQRKLNPSTVFHALMYVVGFGFRIFVFFLKEFWPVSVTSYRP